MTESWSTQINYFIRDAARKNQPIFRSYQHLCGLHPTRVIDYVDFEWKYYQYYHGNSDLNMERSPDSKSPVTFDDLPVDVLGKVVGKSSVLDCLTLRNVSSDLRELVDSSQVHCRRIKFYFGYRFSSMWFDNFERRYKETGDGGCEVTVYRNGTEETKKYRECRDYKQAMIAHAETLLKNPKLKIGSIEFESVGAGEVSAILEYLKSLKFPLDVRSFRSQGKCLIEILHLLKQEKLEEINFEFVSFTLDEFNELLGMEQWKTKTTLLGGLHPKVGLEKMIDFKYIASYNFGGITDSNLIQIRDVLLKSPHLECLCLDEKFSWFELPELVQLYGRLDRIMSEDSAYDARTHRVSIPNSRDFFQLNIDEVDNLIALSIQRVSVP